MNQNEEIRVLYVQPGKYPEEIKMPISSVMMKESCFHYHRTAYMVQRISSQVRF
jgi:hypothetical protein